VEHIENCELTQQLNNIIKQHDKIASNMLGFKFYTSQIGFTQDQLYTLGGRDDSIFTLTFKKDTLSYKKFGESLTVCIVYTLKERQLLENDILALNANPYIKVKPLLPEQNNFAFTLMSEGIDTSDIIEMLVLPNRAETNTFYSKDKREVKVLDIPFELDSNGSDIGWIYGFLKKLKLDGIGLMPEDEAQYLAYKLILENGALTKEEKEKLFDTEGKICNNSVSYYYLMWKKEVGALNEKQTEQLKQLQENRFLERMGLADQLLKDIGLNFKKFASDYPKQAMFLLEKILSFKDRSFNTNGKYPLYMNFKSFLHIYFRHTEELNVCNQFEERDKFQLEEKDIITVITHIMRELNSEYQEYKEKNPNGRFYRRGIMAYYFNGDYYNVDVNPDGSLSTFYKGSGKKKT